MRAYETLREMVKGLGATLTEEHLNPESFGSAYGVFVGVGGGRFRLVWDGKENCGLLQVPAGHEGWKDASPLVRERMGSNFSNLTEFLSSVEVLVSNAKKG